MAVPSMRQSCLLIVGGAALGFFGCLGAIVAGSEGLGFAFLGLGGIVVAYGLAVLARVVWRRMSRPLDHGNE